MATLSESIHGEFFIFTDLDSIYAYFGIKFMLMVNGTYSARMLIEVNIIVVGIFK